MSDTENTPTPEAEETTIIQPAAAPTQKNSSLMLVLVLCIIALIGVVLAVALRKNGDQPKRDLLNNELAAISTGGDMLASSSTLRARVSTIVENANLIQGDHDRMKAGYTTAQQQLNSAKIELAGNLSTISRLSTDYTAMQLEVAKLRSLAARAQSLQQQVNMLSQQLAEKDVIIAGLNTRPSQESLDSARSSLTSERMSKRELTDEIIRLKKRMITMVDQSKLAELQRRLPELTKENQRLLTLIQALRTQVDFKRLFVKSDQLPAKAQALYSELQKLEGKSNNELATAYRLIGSQLNAENMMQVKFETGSSLVSFTDQATMKERNSLTGAQDYFLVVGYASTSGDAASNETLSANRATAVASIVNQLKKQGQDVRAVYLGQTARFSSTSQPDNQLCEIWRIKQ